MNTIDINLKDPISILPNEVLSHSLSFLPPSSIARTTAISRQWRATVHSIQSLHREIDLSNLQEGSEEEGFEILIHFTRLSTLSSHTLVKISLNLTSFYNEWRQIDDNGLAHLDVFFNTLNQSQRSLKQVSFQLVSSPQRADDFDPIDDHSLLFLLRVIRELQDYVILESVTIDANIPMTLKAGGDGRKKCSLNNPFNSARRF